MLKFRMTLQDGDNDPIVLDTGRSSVWEATDVVDKWPDSPSKNSKFDFVWVYCAFRQQKRLAEIGIDEDMSPEEAATYIADSFDVVNIDDRSVGENGKAPLAPKRGKSRK